MKKVLLVLIWAVLAVALVGFLTITVYVNQSLDDEGEVDSSMLTFFYDTYEENREQFRRLAASLQKKYTEVETASHLVKSGTDSDLSIDVVYLPARDKCEKLIIMSSGIHGIEGFTGSAIQRYFLSQVLETETLRNMGVLIIHGLNPYGFKYGRRVSENGVDMNRNFDIDTKLFETENRGYGKINPFLNPQKKAKSGYFRNGFFFLKSVYYILRYKMTALREATLVGQYEFKDAIFFGGNSFEPQKTWLENLILEKINDYEYVFLIDLHTGYGERGKLHFLPGDVREEHRRVLLQKMFADFALDWPDKEKAFYIVRGGFRDFVWKLMPADKKYIGIVFEYGTLNSHQTVGSIRSLHNMILENQGNRHGYENDGTEARVKERFREMFFPSSKIWRSKIMKQTGEVLPVLIDRYSRLGP